MGLRLKKILEEDLLFGLWEIEEGYRELLQTVNVDKEERIILETFRSHLRKIEWLSVRALLKECLNDDDKILYNVNRKPYLANNHYNISISHSHKFTAILLSKTKKVGLDLEYMSHKISNIEKKFINEKEYITPQDELRKYHLYVHWCAKEALYKLLDKQNISFRENVILDPFEPKEQGIVKGTVKNDFMEERYDLHFFKRDNYIFAWSSKSLLV